MFFCIQLRSEVASPFTVAPSKNVMANGHNGTQVLSSLNDSVVFLHDNLSIIGRIVKVHASDKVSLVIFKTVMTDILLHCSLPTITVATSPLAMKSSMVELLETAEVWKIDRSLVTDLPFIIPLHEVESGLFHLSGAQNTYFIWFESNSNGSIIDYQCSMLEPRVAEPLSYRIFRGLNMLSSSITKVFYHQPEGQSMRKSFNIPLAYDAFYYLWCKLCNNSDMVLHI